MKRLSLLIPMFLVAILLQNCAEEETTVPQNIQFTLQVESGTADGRTTADLPAGTALLVSINKSSGEAVYTRKKIELLKLGDGYVTAPLQMPVGAYQITDFLLVNASSEILHAAPLKGSRLAEAVDHPLPYSFNVSKDKTANIDMEVIPAGTKSPADFGFSSFGVGVVNVFQLSVFTGEGSNLDLTDAEAFILNGDDTLHQYSLKSKANLVPFYDDPNTTYTLAVIKHGYARHTQSFTYKDVAQQASSQSMQVILKPAVTMVVRPLRGLEHYFQCLAGGMMGNLQIDWGHVGDQSTQTYPLGMGDELYHYFPADGKYFVSITGDVHMVKSFSGTFIAEDINLGGFTDLKTLSLNVIGGPQTLDLSRNTKLEELTATNLTRLKSIDVAKDNLLRKVIINGCSALAVKSLEGLIDAVYKVSVPFPYHRTAGTFEFSKTYPRSTTMAGPPAAALLQKLREMRDFNQWSVYPNP